MLAKTACGKERGGWRCACAANAVTSDAVTPLLGATRRATSTRLDTRSSDRSRHRHHTGCFATCTRPQERWRCTKATSVTRKGIVADGTRRASVVSPQAATTLVAVRRACTPGSARAPRGRANALATLLGATFLEFVPHHDQSFAHVARTGGRTDRGHDFGSVKRKGHKSLLSAVAMRRARSAEAQRR